MSGKKVNAPVAKPEDTVDLGPVALGVGAIIALPATDANGRNIVLVAAAEKRMVTFPGGKPRMVTVRLSVEREPLDDDEAARVLAVKAERDSARAKREADEQAKREREIGQAVRITAEAERAAFARTASLQAELDMLRRRYAQ